MWNGNDRSTWSGGGGWSRSSSHMQSIKRTIWIEEHTLSYYYVIVVDKTTEAVKLSWAGYAVAIGIHPPPCKPCQ